MGTSFLSKLKTFVLNVFFLACVTLSLVAHAEHETSAEYDSQEDYSQAELDQMLAPIALYPDALLMQILMAATYPLEVEEAARWSRKHGRPEGQRAVRAVENKEWDPSVKSLVAVPNILDMMDKKLDWTERLGEAFLAQQEDVMDTIQDLRDRAMEEDHLASNNQVRVIDRRGYIVIETVNPEVVYVPYYDPLVVYGTWWWPAYRPVYWEPWPAYHSYHHDVGHAILWGATIAVGVGYLFGAPDWHHHDVYVRHVNNYYYPSSHISVKKQVHTHFVPGQRQVWTHQTVHRGAAPYRKEVLTRRYVNTGGRSSLPGQPPQQRSLPQQRVIREHVPAQKQTPKNEQRHFAPDRFKSPDKSERTLPQQHQSERFNSNQKSLEKNRFQQEPRPASQKFQQEKRSPWNVEPHTKQPSFEKKQAVQRTPEQSQQRSFEQRDMQREAQIKHVERPVQTREERRFNREPVQEKQGFSRMQERSSPNQFRAQEAPRQQPVPTEHAPRWGGDAKSEKSNRRFGNE